MGTKFKKGEWLQTVIDSLSVLATKNLSHQSYEIALQDLKVCFPEINNWDFIVINFSS